MGHLYTERSPLEQYRLDTLDELLALFEDGKLTDLDYIVKKAPGNVITAWLADKTEADELHWLFNILGDKQVFYCQEHPFRFESTNSIAKVFYKNEEIFMGFPVRLWDALCAQHKQKWEKFIKI